MPVKSQLRDIDDIISIQPLMARRNQYLIGTKQGLHVIEVLVSPSNKVTFRLCPSDDGDDPMNQFAFSDERISAVVEIEPDMVLVAVAGRAKLYIVNIKNRAAVEAIDNPTGSTLQYSMIKHPAYDRQNRPYVFLKDQRFISVIDIGRKKVLPLVRSPIDMEQLSIHYMGIRLVDDLFASMKNFNKLHNANNNA